MKPNTSLKDLIWTIAISFIKHGQPKITVINIFFIRNIMGFKISYKFYLGIYFFILSLLNIILTGIGFYLRMQDILRFEDIMFVISR